MNSSTVLNSPGNLPLIPFLRGRPALTSFIVLRAIDELSVQTLNVAIAWYIYATTHDPMSLAYVGLARFVPNVGLSLMGGYAADRFNRPKLIGISLLLQCLCVAGFAVLTAREALPIHTVYLLLVVIGAAQAFSSPAMSAMLPRLACAKEFPRAVSVASAVFQVCTLVGPAVGGVIYSLSGPGTFAFSAALYLIALGLVFRLTKEGQEACEKTNDAADASPLGGIRYVRENRLLLGIISLDLFAVLLGGVTALLPIYAKDILSVGPAGLGCLRCAPGIGAAIIGVALAHRTIERNAGKWILLCVSGFGFATIVFALSTNLWLSLAALMLAGAFDMVSMVIRQTLVQVAKPDAMRGRVSAVQWVFIGASSELGEFESGATAALFGTVPAALLGGAGTLVVVALWNKIFPELTHVDWLHMPEI